MPQARDDEYSGAIATADFAFGAFGTVALLMVVFMLTSAIFLERWQSACRALQPGELDTLVVKTRLWIADQQQQNKRLGLVFARHCVGTHTERPGPVVRRVLPEFLAGLCNEAITSVLERAGMRESDIAAVASQADALTVKIATCLGDENSACKDLKADETSGRAAQLLGWYRLQEQELQKALQWLEKEGRECWIKDRSRLPPVAHQTPPALADLCLGSRAKVLEEVKRLVPGRPVAEQDLMRVAADLEVARLGLNRCLASRPDPGCRSFRGNERALAINELRQWADAGRGIDDKYAKLQRACTAETSRSSDDLLRYSSSTIGPAKLIDVCPSDRVEMLREAGLSAGDYNRLRMQEQKLLALSRSCAFWASSEGVTPPVAQVQFYPCESRMIGQGIDRALGGELVAQFNRIAVLVLERMRDPSFNMIDILGHADSHSAKDCLSEARVEKSPAMREQAVAAVEWLIREVIRDNYGLSVQRVIEFRKQLLIALERLEQQGNAEAKSLNGRIKSGEVIVRAIGMGDKRPITADAQSEEDHRRNRRIELRFAADRTGGQR